MANRFWVNGSGDWSDNTNHWSDSSGGSPNASKPTSSDNVYFDANSFSGAGQTVTLDEAANCLDMAWTGATNTPALARGSSALNIYGSLTFISGMTVTGTGTTTFKSTSTGKTVTTAGKTLAVIYFNGTSGAWTLQDNLNCSSMLGVVDGSFSTNNKDVNCGGFYSSGAGVRTVNLGSSTLTTTSYIDCDNPTNLTFNAGTSKIVMTGNTQNFKGGGLTFYDVEFQGTPTTITGSNTFHDLKINAGKTLKLTSGTTQTVTTLTAVGTNGNENAIYSTSAGNPATISDTSGTNTLEYCSVRDIAASGGASFYAINSINVSGNSGIAFTQNLASSIIGTVLATVGVNLLQSLATEITITATTILTLLKKVSSIANARCYSFVFDGKLYIQDTNEYRSYNGTAVSTVTGYIPCLAIATPPAGGGTPYEEINTLNGKKRQRFNGNNSDTVYHIAETAVDSIDSVYVGGALKTLTTHYTVNTTNGTVTFGTAPATGADNVEIYWTKGSGARSTVTANKQSVLFGGANDTRVFMYGVDNVLVYSALADGVPSAEYFPANNFSEIGSDEYDITHLSKQYDRLIIHKDKDTHYSTYEFDATNGASFPTYPLNDSVGNVAFGQGRNVLNNPFIITDSGVYQFTQSNVRDERNAQLMSRRVQLGLDELDLSTALTYEWEKNYEYMLFVGNKGYIYNYKLDVWYYFELADIPTCFVDIDGVLYFGTSLGKLMKFDTDTKTDNGTAISSRWRLGYLAFGANYISKFINFGWVGLQNSGKSKCVLNWESDKGSSSEDYTVEYNLTDFGNVDFSDFTFNTNSSPKPFRLKLKVKKFSYMTLIGENNETTYDMTILNVTLPVTFGGMAK